MKYFKISSVLALISLICALIIGGTNLLTSSVIKANKEKTELETIQKIFADYDNNNSQELESNNAAINKKILAKDKDNNELGYIYNVSGKNAYGTISLMVAIKDGSLYQVEFITNEQSFATALNKKYLDPLMAGERQLEDVSCGATYGAKLVRDMVKEAISAAEYLKGAQNG